MGVFYFPSNFVYWRKVPEHSTFKQQILKYINENPDGHEQHGLIGRGLSSYNNHKSQMFLVNYTEFIKSVVWDTLTEALNELNSRKNTLPILVGDCKIRQCWYSIYNENSNISLHNHETAGREVYIIDGVKFYQSFTVLYIINDKNEKNNTDFIQLASETSSTHTEKVIKFKTSKLEDVGEGTVFIFPSNLYHEVMSIPKGGRVIFSCDIISNLLS
jgi:hypothetical protein